MNVIYVGYILLYEVFRILQNDFKLIYLFYIFVFQIPLNVNRLVTRIAGR
jgi:hypothetical protein